MIREQIESNREIKKNERKQKRQIMVQEDIDIGRLFELAAIDKLYVDELNLHEIIGILLKFTANFELSGSMDIGLLNVKQISILGTWMTLKVILML